MKVVNIMFSFHVYNLLHEEDNGNDDKNEDKYDDKGHNNIVLCLQATKLVVFFSFSSLKCYVIKYQILYKNIR